MWSHILLVSVLLCAVTEIHSYPLTFESHDVDGEETDMAAVGTSSIRNTLNVGAPVGRPLPHLSDVEDEFHRSDTVLEPDEHSLDDIIHSPHSRSALPFPDKETEKTDVNVVDDDNTNEGHKEADEEIPATQLHYASTRTITPRPRLVGTTPITTPHSDDKGDKEHDPLPPTPSTTLKPFKPGEPVEVTSTPVTTITPKTDKHGNPITPESQPSTESSSLPEHSNKSTNITPIHTTTHSTTTEHIPSTSITKKETEKVTSTTEEDTSELTSNNPTEWITPPNTQGHTGVTIHSSIAASTFQETNTAIWINSTVATVTQELPTTGNSTNSTATAHSTATLPSNFTSDITSTSSSAPISTSMSTIEHANTNSSSESSTSWNTTKDHLTTERGTSKIAPITDPPTQTISSTEQNSGDISTSGFTTTSLYNITEEIVNVTISLTTTESRTDILVNMTTEAAEANSTSMINSTDETTILTSLDSSTTSTTETTATTVTVTVSVSPDVSAILTTVNSSTAIPDGNVTLPTTSASLVNITEDSGHTTLSVENSTATSMTTAETHPPASTSAATVPPLHTPPFTSPIVVNLTTITASPSSSSQKEVSTKASTMPTTTTTLYTTTNATNLTTKVTKETTKPTGTTPVSKTMLPIRPVTTPITTSLAADRTPSVQKTTEGDKSIPTETATTKYPSRTTNLPEKPEIYFIVQFDISPSDFCEVVDTFKGKLLLLLEEDPEVEVKLLEPICPSFNVLRSKRRAIGHVYEPGVKVKVYISQKGKASVDLTRKAFQLMQNEETRQRVSDPSYRIGKVWLEGSDLGGQPEGGGYEEDEPVLSSLTIAVIASVMTVCVIGLVMINVIILRRRAQRRRGRTMRPSMRPSLPSDDNFSMTSISVYTPAIARKSRNHKERQSLRSVATFNRGFQPDEHTYSNAMTLSKLSIRSLEVDFLEEELKSIPSNMPKMSSLTPQAHAKNRYANIVPLQETRVHLHRPNRSEEANYINANYVRGYMGIPKTYIATQAPLDTTVVDFWTMIWQSQSQVIIMLMNWFEDNQRRCAQYMPESDGVNSIAVHGNFEVFLKKQIVRDSYIFSCLSLKDMEKNLCRDVVHFQYLDFPAKAAPSSVSNMLKFVNEVRPYMEVSHGPTVIHCSTGTGRTGTFLALEMSMLAYDDSRTIDVMNTVYRLRLDRAGAVHTTAHYAFIYKAMLEYANQSRATNTPTRWSSTMSVGDAGM